MLWLFAGQALAGACRAGADAGILHLQPCMSAVPDAQARQALSGLTVPGYEGNWYRMEIDAAAGMGKRLLDIGIPDAYSIDVHRVTPAGSQTLLALGEESRFSDRVIPHRRLIVPVELHEGRLSLYVHYRTHGNTPLLPRLLTEEQLIAEDTLDNLFNGLLFGVMLVIVPLLAFGLGPQRDRGYRVYALLALANLLFIAQIEGYGMQFAWPDAPAWNMRAPAVLALLVQAAHIVFAMRFLQMRMRMPVLYRWHQGLFGAVVLVALLQLAGRFDELIFALAATYATLACVSSVQGVRHNIPAARFYLLGTLSLVLFTVLLFSFSVHGINPMPQFSALSYPKLGYLAESLLFAAAIASQIRQVKERQAELRMRRLAETEQLLQAEQHKIAALEKARQQQLKLASASHDISQPLASIRFAIAALAQQQEHKPIAEHIGNTLNYAQTLLKDLIVQARQEHQQPERVELDALFEQLSREFSATASAKGLRLSVRGSRVAVPGSSLLLYRILNNLLANAIRYTHKGRILLGVRWRPDAFEIQVWDTGPGIPEAARQALLQPFRQGQDAGAGYGLGLFIVKNLCEQCGYRLSIHSTLGRGSGFCLRVPHAAEAAMDA